MRRIDLTDALLLFFFFGDPAHGSCNTYVVDEKTVS